ncbi:MAG TPA: ornithine cyclodeaminase family protein [Candidatus Acidoferrum sp.]|nr:ornithine cyclodeaminase family protein [Candidatus Acidoferrum sp.]
MTEAKVARSGELLILRQSDFDARLPERDVLNALRAAIASLANGSAVQPPQVAGLVADQLDVIWYSGILSEQKLFGAKLSPYFPARKDGPKVTAWTVLLSAETGDPILLCDSLALTTERTAGTTALALELLMPAGAKRLAIIGVGAVGMAHLRYASTVHEWNQVQLYSRTIDRNRAVAEKLPPQVREKIKIAESAEAAVWDSDVVLLCTSSGSPVIDHRWLRPGQLITSITTNAPDAHEIAPEALTGLEIYCDYRVTTPGVAGEMKLAARNHSWTPDSICGDLPQLISGKARQPTGRAPIFFRSVGLGIEDIAIASALLNSRRRGNEPGFRGGTSR